MFRSKKKTVLFTGTFVLTLAADSLCIGIFMTRRFEWQSEKRPGVNKYTYIATELICTFKTSRSAREWYGENVIVYNRNLNMDYLVFQ